MKKNMILMMVLVAIAAMTTITSCVTPDDTKRIVDYEMVVSQDLLDLCDVTVLYKGVNGKDTSEMVTDTIWKKSVVSNTLPLKFGMRVKAEPKPGVTLDKETCDLKAVYSYQLVKWNHIVFSIENTFIDKQVPAAHAQDSIIAAKLNPSDWSLFIAAKGWVEMDTTCNKQAPPRLSEGDLQQMPYKGPYEEPTIR